MTGCGRPAAAAVDWLVPAGCAVAVDLAAGTGLFTRALEGRAGQVVAVEPDERMRHVLAARSAGVRVLDGQAEDIPLPDGCADAVLVSHAWHWFDSERAVPEIARVLTDGGRLGVVWTSRDRGEDWVAGLDVIRSPEEPRTRTRPWNGCRAGIRSRCLRGRRSARPRPRRLGSCAPCRWTTR